MQIDTLVFRKLAGRAFVAALFIIAAFLTVYLIHGGVLLDFEIYYEAGRALLSGVTPYQFYGKFELPFQYFPWVGWMFMPLALLPMRPAWIFFAALNLGLLGYSIYLLAKTLDEERQVGGVLNFVHLSSNFLILSLLVFQVGQISIFILFACTLTVRLLLKGKPEWAALLAPFLLIKPHLMLLFFPYLLWNGRKRYAGFALLTIGVFVAVSLFLNPHWPQEMYTIIRLGQDRGDKLLWGFSTLAGALELRNWRVLNFYFAVPSFIISLFALIRMEKLPEFHRLAFALALSVFAAPYSFAYDFPLLIPALLIFAQKGGIYRPIFFSLAVIIPLFSQYQGQTYLSIVGLVGLILVETHSTRNSLASS